MSLKNLIIPPKLKQKLAESYWSKSDDIYTGKIAPDIFKLATENIDKFDRILEFGSNNGSNLEFFIKNMKDISVLGIDNTGKVFLLFMVSLSIMIISARAGASGTQLSKIHAAHSLGASKKQILRYPIL